MSEQNPIDILNAPFQVQQQQSLGAVDLTALEGLPTSFMAAWPIVKPILQAAAGMIGWVPAWGPTAVLVLTGLINLAQSIWDEQMGPGQQPRPAP